MRISGLSELLIRIWETGLSLKTERGGQWEGHIDAEYGGVRS